jgi:hypothetical protein
MKTKSQAKIKKMWHWKAWTVWSRFVRSNEADHRGFVKCTTCSAVKHWRNMHAGHFRHDAYDFEAWNIHTQCPKCNTFEHGQLGMYYDFMIKRYGQTEAEKYLKLKKWNAYTLDQLKEIYEKYKTN